MAMNIGDDYDDYDWWQWTLMMIDVMAFIMIRMTMFKRNGVIFYIKMRIKSWKVKLNLRQNIFNGLCSFSQLWMIWIWSRGLFQQIYKDSRVMNNTS